MKRLALFLLLAGCQPAAVRVEGSHAVLENDRLRVDFMPEGGGVSIRRGGGWVPVALLRGPGFEKGAVQDSAIVFPDARFMLDGPRLRFQTRGELQVEVVGKRSMALFPGLEFLEEDEPSSSDRDAHGPLADRRRPDPAKITVPLAAFEVNGSLVALLWKDSRPAFFEAREKNRMAVAGEAILLVEPGASIYDAVPRWIDTFGLPPAEPWPRTLEEELALCREGFRTVAVRGGKFRHCAGKDWPPQFAPGFAVLLHLLGEKIDWEDYPDLLDTANCHVLKWEAPFLSGNPQGVLKLKDRLLLLSQDRIDGEWGFHPMDEKQAALGTSQDRVLGTSAYSALSIAKAARMTGDDDLRGIALEALSRMRRHRVPRGAQNWECPLYEPDLLAAAYAVGGYVEAFKLTGEQVFLKEAIRWAKAGLPFLYLWSLPDRHGMLYASIPVFGTTQFTHPWFGTPVQWNGLVYAYYLRKLAPLDRSFPWTSVANGITASGVHQQYADGPSKGCYPDGFYDQCTRRAPPDLNPEDLVVNILTAEGRDPDPDYSIKK
jgi:hypothetical protein